MLLPRLGQSRDRDGENIRFVRPEASVDQVRSPAIQPPSRRGRQSRLANSCAGTGVGFPKGTQT